MKLFLLLIFIVAFVSIGKGQSKEFKAFVRIKKNTLCIKKEAKPIKVKYILPTSSVFKSAKSITVSGTKYTGDGEITVPAGTAIEIEKPGVPTDFNVYQDLKANITQSKDTLLINFWIVPGLQDTASCEVAEDKSAQSPKTADKYYIILQNRQSKVFNTGGFEIGALVVPFKYRFGKGDISPEVTSDVANITLFAGWKIGQVKYWYNKYEPATPTKWSITVGPFIGLGKETLKAGNTTIDPAKFTGDATKDIGTFSYGAAILANIHDIRLGVHLGFDHAYGKYKSTWDYQNRFWIGFGLGFRLPFFKQFGE